MTDASRLAALDYNYLLSQSLFMGQSTRGEVRETRDLLLVCCGLPAAEFNFGFPKAAIADLPGLIERTASYFDERGLPFHVQLREDAADAYAQALEAAGLLRDPKSTPGMLLPFAAGFAKNARDKAAASGLEIHEVTTPDDRARFAETAFGGFGLPAPLAHEVLHDALHALPPIRFFLGSRDGVPVATSALLLTHPVAGVYWVATLEGHRGRGFGEGLTWAAVAAGAESGCEVASLQASALGRPVYERMGFRRVLDYVRFDPRRDG